MRDSVTRGFGVYPSTTTWTPGTKAFQAFGGVQFKVGQDIDAEGGWWCNPGGPVANYTWSVSGNTLTLTPGGKTPAASAVHLGRGVEAGPLTPLTLRA